VRAGPRVTDQVHGLLDVEAIDAKHVRSMKGLTFVCVGHPACPVATANSDAITRRMAAAIGGRNPRRNETAVSALAAASSPGASCLSSQWHAGLMRGL
jgi:hypothetical protein